MLYNLKHLFISLQQWQHGGIRAIYQLPLLFLTLNHRVRVFSAFSISSFHDQTQYQAYGYFSITNGSGENEWMAPIRLGKHTHKIKQFTLFSNWLAQYFVAQIILQILFTRMTISIYRPFLHMIFSPPFILETMLLKCLFYLDHY